MSDETTSTKGSILKHKAVAGPEGQATTAPTRKCSVCWKPIVSTDAVAVLVKEGNAKSLVHVSCLITDLHALQ